MQFSNFIMRILTTPDGFKIWSKPGKLINFKQLLAYENLDYSLISITLFNRIFQRSNK